MFTPASCFESVREAPGSTHLPDLPSPSPLVSSPFPFSRPLSRKSAQKKYTTPAKLKAHQPLNGELTAATGTV
ncbi:hypothetical protein SLEP1_g2410 [Rubroshorea leprosula]|uniref:Uncharacterized protein n=1 Tax=Rubroshorea leprosula TaxID=152421 RepID=A0AAV5HRA2_9ROSI|nr:hypothetical protein SLEP1_g2410 [Rubroshorea leprosula]